MHHIIRKGYETMKKWELYVIPNSREAYLNLRARVTVPGTKTEGKKEKRLILNFIDSLQFMSASLSDLIKNCPNLSLTSTLPGSMSVKMEKVYFHIII